MYTRDGTHLSDKGAGILGDKLVREIKECHSMSNLNEKPFNVSCHKYSNDGIKCVSINTQYNE